MRINDFQDSNSGFINSSLRGYLFVYIFIMQLQSSFMSQCACSKINELKRSSGIVLLKSVLIKRRPESALSTNALVADVVNKMLSTFFVFGNIASRLLFEIYFSIFDKLLNSFCCDAQHFIHKLIS